MDSNFVKEVLLLAKRNGYKTFEIEGHDTFGYIVTPSDNVLCVNRGDFGGVTFTFEYVPSREHGMGCACLEDALYEVGIDDLVKAEKEGQAFAFRLKAKRYPNSMAWIQGNYWNQKNMLREVSE